MKRSELPLDCRKSEVKDLPVIACAFCGRDVPPTVRSTGGLAASPDPVCVLTWKCPDPLCYGPFEP